MGKLAMILMLFCSMVIAMPLVDGLAEGPEVIAMPSNGVTEGPEVIAMPLVDGVAQGPGAVQQWFQSLSHGKEKVTTKLHFYLQDKQGGENPIQVLVAQANITSESPTSFGATLVYDYPLTVSPEPSSTEVGRAQGLYCSADVKEVALLMPFTIVFTSGQYNGSTLSVLGRNAIYEQFRELPVVGGSGVFRLAQGIVTVSTYSENATASAAVREYNLVVLHYE